MTDVRPLPVYPRKPVNADLELIKQAKKELNLDILIQPVKAVAGSPGRILALRETPDFICDHALVKNPTVESIKAALTWILLETEDKRGVTARMMLSEILGGEVNEITD